MVGKIREWGDARACWTRSRDASTDATGTYGRAHLSDYGCETRCVRAAPYDERLEFRDIGSVSDPRNDAIVIACCRTRRRAKILLVDVSASFVEGTPDTDASKNFVESFPSKEKRRPSRYNLHYGWRVLTPSIWSRLAKNAVVRDCTKCLSR